MVRFPDAFRRVSFVMVIVLYVLLLTLQIDLYPGERFPGWDHFWVDVRTMGKLLSLKDALQHGELPYIVPGTDFGWNLGGDHHSFWNPLNLLVLIVSPQATIVLTQVVFLGMGSMGAFLFLRKVTSHKLVSFLGGFTYVAIPYVLGLFYYEQSSYIFYLVPWYLLIIMRVLEHSTSRRWLLLALLSAFAVGSSDLYSLIILPTVGFLFTFLMAYKYYGKPLARALGIAFLAFTLSLLSASFYALPLYANLNTITHGLDLIKAAGVPVPQSNVDFVGFFLRYGAESLVVPREGSALQLYIPALFYVAAGLALLFNRVLFDTDRKQVVVIVTLGLLGTTMFLISYVFYHPIFVRLVPSAGEAARGVLRYHINLIPFVNLLAGFISLAAASQCRRHERKMAFFLATILLSISVDFFLFAARGPGPRLFESSNRVELPLSNALHGLPLLNACFGVIVALDSRWEQRARTVASRNFRRGLLIFSAALLGLTNISLHNQALAQSESRFLARNPYRIENFLKRKACVDTLIARDPNYRILFGGRGNISPAFGRDWKLIAETELHVADRRKVLFSYREFTEPYVGLLWGTFEARPGFRQSNLWPPLSDQISHNLAILKLIGVRYVISADEKIESPDFVFKGRCISGMGDYSGPMWSQTGLAVFNASLVENNLLDQAFHTDMSGPGAQVMADTGAGYERDFVGVILQVGPQAVNATWDVQWSDDGMVWNTVYKAAGGRPFGPGRFRYSWRKVGKHRFWRLVKTDQAAPGSYHNEVEFFDEGGPGFFRYNTENGFLYVYEVTNPTGIAFLANDSRKANSVDGLRLIYERTEFPWLKGVVLLETPPRETEEPDSSAAEPSAAAPAGWARIIKETYGTITVAVSTPSPKFLVLSYTFRPQWRAYIDSSEARVNRAYGGFMSVRLPPGEHTIEFKYRPTETHLGSALTLLAFALAAVVPSIASRKHRGRFSQIPNR